MIINQSDYNPLQEIFKYKLDKDDLTVNTLNTVQRELFKAGVIPEDILEFDKVLGLLQELARRYHGKE